MILEQSDSGFCRSGVSPPPDYGGAGRFYPAASPLLCALLISILFPSDATPQPSPPTGRSEQIVHLSTETRYALRALQYVLTPEEFNELISERHDF